MGRKLIISIVLFLFVQEYLANDTVYIKTSAQCMACKKRIEPRMNKLKGIISSHLNLESKLLMIEYDKTLISQIDIENKITEIGYDANGREAKKSSYKRLPVCCRKDYKGSH